MAYNLSRNSRVFVTTNTDANGVVSTTGLTTSNCWEVQVLDGFKFSQGTANTAIQIKEAGATPIRGQRAFNTALNPVDISFSTYIRPRLTSSQTTCDERVLWNALVGSVGIDTTFTAGTTQVSSTIAGGTAITRSATTSATATITGGTVPAGYTTGDIVMLKGGTATNAALWYGPVKLGANMTAGAFPIVMDYLTPPVTSATAICTSGSWKFDKAAWVEVGAGYATGDAKNQSHTKLTTGLSNKNQLQVLGMIFVVDNATYTIDNVVLDQAQIDFGLDAIAAIAWTAKGKKLNALTGTATYNSSTGAFSGTNLTGTATATYATPAQFITNKLSTLQLKSLIGNVGDGGGSTYTIPLTGGSITIANGVNYITPNNIGTVNVPVGYFTGTRAVSGTINAYMRTGTGNVADLLSTMMSTISTATETKYRMQIEIGGYTSGTSNNRVELEIPGCVIGVPSVDVADVITTAITFNAQGTDKSTLTSYDLENTNDLEVRYFAIA